MELFRGLLQRSRSRPAGAGSPAGSPGSAKPGSPSLLGLLGKTGDQLGLPGRQTLIAALWFFAQQDLSLRLVIVKQYLAYRGLSE